MMPDDIDKGFRELGGKTDFFWRGKKDVNKQARVNFVTSVNQFGSYKISLDYTIEIIAFVDFAVIKAQILAVAGEKRVVGENFFRPFNKYFDWNSYDSLDNSHILKSLNSDELFFNDTNIIVDDQEKYDYRLKDVSYGHRGILSKTLFLTTWESSRRSEVRQPQRTDEVITRLLPDYSNLALVLNEIKNRDPKLLNEPLSHIIPNFERLNIEIFGGNIAISISERDVIGTTSAHRMSDGTLRFLVILAALYCHERPSILVIEEPEIGLHPDALVCLARLFKEASAHTQIFITTHSEVLLSAFRDQLESVLVCQNHGEGTVISHLDPDDIVDIEEMLLDHSLGQVWASGKIGGNP